MVRLFCIQKGYREERGKLKVQLNRKESSYSKLPELLAAFPNKYQIKRYEGKGGATIIAYKCL